MFVRRTRSAVFAESPFAESSGVVAGIFGRHVERICLFGNRPIAFHVVGAAAFLWIDAFEVLRIAAAAMTSGEQHIARWRADWRTAVIIRPPLAAGCEAVQVISVTSESQSGKSRGLAMLRPFAGEEMERRRDTGVMLSGQGESPAMRYYLVAGDSCGSAVTVMLSRVGSAESELALVSTKTRVDAVEVAVKMKRVGGL